MDDAKSSTSIAQGKTTSARRFPQYLAAFTVSIGAFGQGTVLAWSSPAGLPLMDGAMGFPVDSEQLSWTGALMPLGALVVMAPMGWAIDRLGRKNTMLLLVVPFLVGWALIMWPTSVGMLYAGRFLTGMAGGAFSVSGPVYTAEIAQKEIRGLLGSFYQVLLTFGVLFTFAAGSVLSPFWLSTICAAVPVLFAATFVFMPETPVYFLRNDQGEKARHSLRWLRGPEVDLEPELQELQLAVDEERKNQASLRDAFRTLGAKKGLLVSAGLLVFQQLSGVNSATFYTTVIFKDAGSKMAPTQATIIIGTVQVVTTIVSCLVVDRLGRRILLLTSDLVMSLCMFALGAFFYLQHVGHDTSALTWLPVTSLSVFFVAYALG
uniref:(California timema) hypothetical protein n=1 Tax=Timema californicum TaxID=61474 RepID=A0A7R9JIE6_TIMCA|nr:unnamed protein product [Timema californicum]